jgi:hypothetical protein
MERAQEGWDVLSQESINRWVDRIPYVLNKCLEGDGAMTRF